MALVGRTGGDKAGTASLTLAAMMAETGGMTPPSTALTVAEAARRMNVTRQTVYLMCHNGRLRCFRPGTGRALRIPLDAIEECETKSAVREPAPCFPDIIKRYCYSLSRRCPSSPEIEKRPRCPRHPQSSGPPTSRRSASSAGITPILPGSGQHDRPTQPGRPVAHGGGRHDHRRGRGDRLPGRPRWHDPRRHAAVVAGATDEPQIGKLGRQSRRSCPAAGQPRPPGSTRPSTSPPRGPGISGGTVVIDCLASPGGISSSGRPPTRPPRCPRRPRSWPGGSFIDGTVVIDRLARLGGMASGGTPPTNDTLASWAGLIVRNGGLATNTATQPPTTHPAQSGRFPRAYLDTDASVDCRVGQGDRLSPPCCCLRGGDAFAVPLKNVEKMLHIQVVILEFKQVRRVLVDDRDRVWVCLE